MDVAEILIVGDDADVSVQIGKLVAGVKDCCAAPIQFPASKAVSRLISDSVAAAIVVHDGTPEAGPTIRKILEAAKGLHVPVVVVSEATQAERMMEWLRLGATDCLLRSVDLARLPRLIDSLTFPARSGFRRRMSWLSVDGLPPFCIASRQSRELVEHVLRVIDRDANVLITGETGTGKTHLAKLIHALSTRSKEPFLAMNCAAIPETLVESQLFGHVRGAFTGADSDNMGAFSHVGKGTLLLDEVEALSLASQAKLLHAVEERSYVAVGTYVTKEFHGRLIVATNQCLDQLVAERRFRMDLYYRLDVLQLHVPALRERPSEIRHLAEEYLRTSARRNHSKCNHITAEAMAFLESYAWPGNVRQLQNVLEQAAAASTTDEIRLADIPLAIRGNKHTFEQDAALLPEPLPDVMDHEQDPEPSFSSRRPLEQARADGESDVLARFLKANNNNRTATARQLGISRTALYKRMRKLGLT